MSLPKKNKVNINIDPPIVGSEYLRYGMDRIEELMRQTDTKTKYLPKTILFEDLDDNVYEFFNSGKMKFILNGKEVPTFYMDLERWGEFSKTWVFVDDDKNIATPYITIRRIDKQNGTRLGVRNKIPQPKKFSYINIPILDDGQVLYLQYKIPQPTNIDLLYEISLFSKYRVDINQYDEQIFKIFSSRQEYVFPKNNPMPILFEGSNEQNNTIENINGDKFYVSKYTFKLLGFIQDEKDFEIVKSTRKPKFGYTIE